MPASSMATVSPPIAFIFEWSSTASTPSPRSIRLAPAIAPHDAVPLACGSKDLEVRRRRRHSPPWNRSLPRWRMSATSGGGSFFAGRFEHLADSQRIPGFEGPSSQPKPHFIARSTSLIE
jgi:hypothetical protein